MSYTESNYLTSGSRQGGSPQDVLQAACGPASGLWHGFQPLDALVGRYKGQGAGGIWGYFVDNWIEGTIGGVGTGMAVIDTDPGFLRVVTRATGDGDAYNDQFSDRHGTPTVSEIFLPAANKNIYFECRVRVDNTDDDAQTNSRLWIGLSDINTDIQNAQDDLIMFRKDAADAQIDAVLYKGGSATASTNEGTLVNNTWINLGFRVNGTSSVVFYIDDAVVLTQSTVTNLADEELALSWQVETNEAAAVTLDVQRITAYQEV